MKAVCPSLDRIVSHVADSYMGLDPRLTPRDTHRQLKDWLSMFDGHRHIMSSAMGVEAALGIAHMATRKRMLAAAKQSLGEHAVAGIREPSGSLIRKNRIANVAGLLSTRQLNNRLYQGESSALLHALFDVHRSLSTRPGAMDGYGGNIAGALMEQTVLCLLHEPSAGMVAVPSFLRQDENEWSEEGKKVRWDVTVESDGSTVPEGQYWLQAKRGARDSKMNGYHPDIIVVSGTKHFGDSEDINVPPRSAIALVTDDREVVVDLRIKLHDLLAAHGPSAPEPYYLAA